MHGPGPQIGPYTLTAVLFYNVVLLVVDLAALYWLRRGPTGRRLAGLTAAGLGAVAGMSLLGAALFRGGVFMMMGLLAHGLFGHGLLYLLGAAWVLGRERPRTAVGCGVTGVILAGVFIYAFHIEPYRLEVREVVLTSAKVKRPLRIVVLADLQTDDVGPYERRVLEAAMRARPDLILMPGDFIQCWSAAERSQQAARLRQLWREVGVTAPLGVYAVGGNCEGPGWPALFAGLPVTTAEPSAVFDQGALRITALDMERSFRSEPIPAAPPGKFHVVFGHSPDFALGRVEADLLVAGHTHGGQVRLPVPGRGLLPLLTFCDVPRAWAAGVTHLSGGRTLVVSRGLGMERGSAPRLRFLCRPEIVVIEVRPAR